MSIQITEEFKDDQGRLQNYYAYDVDQDAAIRAQRHVDIRTFTSGWQTTPAFLFALEGKALSVYEGDQMQQLDAGAESETDEQWTMGTAGRQADLNHLRGLKLTCAAGLNVTSSIEYTLRAYEDPAQATPEELYRTIDLSDFDPTADDISIALPNFPLASINTANSFVDFTSAAPPLGAAPTPNNTTNGAVFTAGPTVSIPFNASTVALVAGNSEFRVPLSSLTGIDTSKITGVRFRIQANAPCTFYASAVRLLTDAWKYLPWDVNTKTENLERPAARNGDLTPIYSSTQAAPFDATWPALFRANTLSNSADPQPIDAHVLIAFNSGSLDPIQSEENSIRVFFRERTEDFMTQLDLDGVDTNADGDLDFGFSQADLDAGTEHDPPRLSQPDYGAARYVSLPQSYLDTHTQDALDEELQAELERLPDELSAAWIEARLGWSGTEFNLAVKNTETIGGQEYRWDFIAGLEPNTDYAFDVKLEDNSLRAQIIPLGSQGELLTPIFDTYEVVDDFMFQRRKGRVGWQAFINDADAVIYGIRTRSLAFAEYRSLPLNSMTPVEGAQLFVSASPPLQSFTDVYPADRGGEITEDRAKVTTGADHSYRVRSRHTLEGIKTNVFEVFDFAQTIIKFDVWFPQASLEAGASLDAFLIGEQGRIINLTVEPITPNTWQSIEIDPAEGRSQQTGPYRLVIVQLGEVATTWWIQNIRIEQRQIAWSARSNPGDAWGMHEGRWVDFGDLINDQQDGILFPERGTALQVRGVAQNQEAYIERVSFKPKYAELGRLVFDDPPNTASPTASFTYIVSGLNVAGTSTSTANAGRIAHQVWHFGDGEYAFGDFVQHTYAEPGTYPVTLTVTDSNNRMTATTQDVTVT